MVEQAAIAGSASEGVYSQTLVAGNFFITLSLAGSEAVDMELGRNTLAKIEEMVIQTPAISPKEVVEIIRDEFKNGITVDLAMAKIESQKLTLAAVGQVGAKLVRASQVVNLFARHDPRAEVQTISGPVFQDDLLIVATTAFFGLLNGTDLLGGKAQSVTELRDALLPKVEGLADDSKIAALLIKIDLLEKVAEETQTPPPEIVTATAKQPQLSPLIAQFKRGLYLKNQEGDAAPQLRRSIYLAIVVLVSLISLVAFQLRSRAMEQKTQLLAAMEKQLQDGVDSAQKLTGVNDNIARDILLQSRKDFLAKAEATFGANWQSSKSSESTKLKAILAALDEKITTISHIYNVSQLSTFYDFGLLKSGVKIVASTLTQNEIIALDQANGAIYTVGTKNKTAAIVTGSDDLKLAKWADGNADNIFIWKDSGISKIDRSAKIATAKQIITASDKWGDIKGLRAFAANLYLLDITNNQVWKYQGIESGFADIAPYLKGGSLDFSKVVSWAIDGYIYVLSSSGNVVRFASGYADEFQLAGLPESLSNPSSIFASDETENIYILDGNKVIITDKKGVYNAEYILPNAVSGTVLADESVKKVFLVSGDKVFSFDLR